MGTMRERAQGTWELSVAAGRDPDTGAYRRVIRTVKGVTKRETKAALAELEVAVAAGRVGADDPTLAELLERWMEHLAGLGRSDSTLYNYGKYIDREIVPALGSNRLSKLSPLDIDRFYTKLRKRGLSSSTIRQMHAILRASLNQAERWGLVHRNVAKLASAPSQEQREQLPPEPAMVRAMLVAAREFDPLFGLYVRIAVAIGARRAEVCGLRWSDIDLEAGSLTVQRSYLAIPGAKGDRPTKTRSARTVSLDPDTIAALETGWSTAVRIAELVGMTEAEGPPALHVQHGSARAKCMAARCRQRQVGGRPLSGARRRERSAARPAPLPGDAAPRCGGAGANGCRSTGPRRRHDDDEDLRPQNASGRRARSSRRGGFPRRTRVTAIGGCGGPNLATRVGTRHFHDGCHTSARCFSGGRTRCPVVLGDGDSEPCAGGRQCSYAARLLKRESEKPGKVYPLGRNP